MAFDEAPAISFKGLLSSNSFHFSSSLFRPPVPAGALAFSMRFDGIFFSSLFFLVRPSFCPLKTHWYISFSDFAWRICRRHRHCRPPVIIGRHKCEPKVQIYEFVTLLRYTRQFPSPLCVSRALYILSFFFFRFFFFSSKYTDPFKCNLTVIFSANAKRNKWSKATAAQKARKGNKKHTIFSFFFFVCIFNQLSACKQRFTHIWAIVQIGMWMQTPCGFVRAGIFHSWFVRSDLLIVIRDLRALTHTGAPNQHTFRRPLYGPRLSLCVPHRIYNQLIYQEEAQWTYRSTSDSSAMHRTSYASALGRAGHVMRTDEKRYVVDVSSQEEEEVENCFSFRRGDMW